MDHVPKHEQYHEIEKAEAFFASDVVVDHEHCADIGTCWQDRRPCPTLDEDAER